MSEPTSKTRMPTNTFTDANANSFSDKVLRWELLQNKLAPLLDSMPHVKPVYEELVQLIAKAKSHVFEQKSLQVAAQKGSEARKEMIRTGDGIRSRLALALGFEHGATNVQLKEFGLRPRKAGSGRKGKGSQTPPPTPEPQQPEVPTQAGAHAPAPAGGGAAGTTK